MNLYNLFRYIGFRHLISKPSRAILTTLGVAFGIALYVAIAIINHSIKDSMRESIESVAGKAKLSVTAGMAGFDESKLELIRTTHGVKSAVPLVEARAFFVGSKESSDGLQIMGVDLLQDTSVRSYKATDQRIIDDPLVFLNQADSIILTKSVATARGLKIDSKIMLSTANGARQFTVRGLLEPEGAAKAYGGALALMDIDGVRMSFGKENKLDRVDIVPEKDISVEQLKADLETTLGGGFHVDRPEAQSEATEKVIGSYQMILTFFSTLALLVGLFLVMNSISVAVAERKKEIGVLRALGATRLSMVILFVSEVFGIGLVGSLIGVVLGRGLAVLLSNQVTTSVGAQLGSQINITKLELGFKEAIFVVAVGIIASMLAGFIPALKAAAVHPLEAMKRHAESLSRDDEKKGRLIVILGLALLIYNAAATYFRLGRFGWFFDLSTKGASVLGAAFFGPYLVFLLLRGFRAITRKQEQPVLRLAQENLIKSQRRTTSNVMALMIGLYLVVLIGAVRASFHDTLTNWLDQIFVADMIVGSSGRFIMADTQPLKEEIQDELLKIPGVREVGAGRGTRSRIVPFFYQGERMTIKAMDHFSELYHYRNFAVPAGDAAKVAHTIYDTNEAHVLVTDSFLNYSHKKVGDTVALDSPSGKVSFSITGVVTDFAAPKGVFYMNREVYKKYWKDSLVTGFNLSVAPGFTVEEVRQNIDRALGKKWNLVSISNQEFKLQMQTVIDRTFAYTRAIEFIALLVGALGLLNTLLISVLERTREIGMLRAIGSTRRQISQMIFFEGILQGFFGAVVSVGLGSLMGSIFVKYGLSVQLGWLIDFHFPKEAVFSTLFAGIFVAGVASVLPARRASYLQITEALDYE